MTLEEFQIVYSTASVTISVVPFWLLRKSRGDLLILSLVSFIFLSFFMVLYLDAGQYVPDTLFEEHLFRAFTHFKGNIFLTLSNALFWGGFPVGIGMFLRTYKQGTRLVWVVFAIFTLLKTFFDDYFLNHTYPETLVHPYEWDSVLIAWLIVYSLAALFITKGIESLTKE